jgi:hypothetical protein
MNIDYLDTILSACFTLRKMKSIIIEEEVGEFSMRPQLHIIIVSPFGTFKSSLTKKLSTAFVKAIHKIDDFTKAGIEGSISKDGEYVPPLIMRLGGKVLIIDEWNSIDYFGQASLLGLLENQKISRVIGFKVKKPFEYKDKHGHISIDENRIEGEVQFSCISYAMEYPVVSQKDKALLSRFTPLFIQPTIDYIKQHTKGSFTITVCDYSRAVENVRISKAAYEAFHEKYFDFLENNQLVPFDSDDYGYMTRIMSDIVRLGVYNYLQNNPTMDKSIVIENPSWFVDMIPYAQTLMQQYTNPKTKGKFEQYRELLKKFPNREKAFYYKALGITRETLYIYDKKLSSKVQEVDV